MALTAALGVRAGRRLTTWQALAPGQQQLLTALGLTPGINPLAPGRRPRRSFDRPAPGTLPPPRRAPTVRETIRVDGDTVNLGAWLAKARTKHRTGQLPGDHARLVAALFDGDWTTETTAPVVLA
ncbi:helicase associated domain-containing protein [Streptomyces flaveolus]|uniref:helicase associated domain-containing protein n=1 Tax=Streptomyces flaveolus TaxID=67297 RepID=UPI00343B0625